MAVGMQVYRGSVGVAPGTTTMRLDGAEFPPDADPFYGGFGSALPPLPVMRALGAVPSDDSLEALARTQRVQLFFQAITTLSLAVVATLAVIQFSRDGSGR